MTISPGRKPSWLSARLLLALLWLPDSSALCPSGMVARGVVGATLAENGTGVRAVEVASTALCHSSYLVEEPSRWVGLVRFGGAGGGEDCTVAVGGGLGVSSRIGSGFSPSNSSSEMTSCLEEVLEVLGLTVESFSSLPSIESRGVESEASVPGRLISIVAIFAASAEMAFGDGGLTGERGFASGAIASV